MALTRKQLAAIGQIKPPAAPETMDDAQLEAFCKRLDKLVTGFPGHSEAAKKAFSAGDYPALSRSVMAITGMLVNLGMSDYGPLGMDLLQKYKQERKDEAEAMLGDMLAAVSELSIDIQMSPYRGYAPGEDYVMGVEGGARQKTVMAVDDVAMLLNTLKSMLADTEYHFVGAVSGAAALKYLSKNSKPDLFILDIEMPVMNGYELAAMIRSLGHKAPIVFLTGNATNDYVLKAIQAGAADFIVKPVNRKNVLEKIRRFT